MFSEAPAELTVVTHAALAFVLAWTIGYERFYNGRAAGTQVYCLVCTASCALTSATGLAGNWFGTRQLADANGSTQVIASLLTGLGFLGAGIIVESGASVRGLTGAIWPRTDCLRQTFQGRTLNWVVEDLPDIQSIESFTVTRTSRT
jgi:uncharacterized membrane protein YhiD involved in acid resistance